MASRSKVGRTELISGPVWSSRVSRRITTTQKGWRDLVNNLPKTIEDAYARLLRQVSNVDAQKVDRLFHLIIAAQRPLTLEEMDIALCAWENVQDKLGALSEDDLDLNSAFSDWVRQACGLFVTIYDNQLFFIHQTAKEFLLAEGGEPDVVRESDRLTASWQRCITLTATHRVMAESCIAYLSMDGFRSAGFRDELINLGVLRDGRNSRKWRYVRSLSTRFCAYAVDYWSHHFDRAQTASHDGITDISNGFESSYFSLFGQDNPLSSPWSITAALQCERRTWSRKQRIRTIELVDGDEYRCIEGFTPLGLRAALGHFGAIHAILEKRGTSASMLSNDGLDDLALRRENGSQAHHRPRSAPRQPNLTRLPCLAHQPIFFAVALGRYKCLEYILATWRQSQLGALAPDGTPFLLFAASYGRYRAVTLLLQHGFDYTIQDQHGDTLVDAFVSMTYLVVADREECDESLRFLVTVSQASQWKPDWSCLLRFVASELEPHLPKFDERVGQLALAMECGRPEALKTLRESQAFTRAYEESLVKTLVDRGATVHAVDEEGRSPLHLACRFGAFWTFMFLLENTPSTSNVDLSGQTALHHVCECIYGIDSNKMVGWTTMLLQFGIDINLADAHGQTALHLLLMARPQAKGVEVLLKNGASVEVRAHGGRSAFHFLRQYAVTSEVVDLLLKHGADIDAMDDQGNTPLMSVLSEDDSDLYTGQALLSGGANLHARNKAGETPLGRLRDLRSAYDVGGGLSGERRAKEYLSSVIKMLAWADSENTMNE